MRKIIVSALGPAGPSGRPRGAEAVKLMQEFWCRQLDSVLPDKPDLISVPECSDRFREHSIDERIAYYRERGDQMREFWRKIARDNHSFVAYSAVRELPDGSFRNSTQLLDRKGEVIAIYDKNYPVVEETTVGNILPGKTESVVDCELGRVGFAICFDLNFRELADRYAIRQPHLLLFCSMYHGGLMQSYWAYRCRSWFVGTICDIESSILNPLGSQTAQSTKYRPAITAQINTDYEVVHLDYNWEKLAAAKQKYGRKIKIFDPGKLGAVLITSESAEISAAEVVKEFELERLDDYYQRATQHREKYLG